MHLRKAKPRRPPPEPRPCGACGVPIPNGTRCVRCRVAKCRGRAVEDSACVACGVTWARALTPVQLADARVPMCRNHVTLADALAGSELTLEAFLAEAAEREVELTPIPASVRKAG